MDRVGNRGGQPAGPDLADPAHPDRIEAAVRDVDGGDVEIWYVGVGQLVGARRPASISRSCEDHLGDFADLVSTAIANTETCAALTASWARLVAAADEARPGSSAICTTAPSSGSCR
ncbi:hypothetical protein [Mycolicibacterium sp. A43C]